MDSSFPDAKILIEAEGAAQPEMEPVCLFSLRLFWKGRGVFASAV